MVSLMDVYKGLPGTNCKECGEESCMNFAMKLLKGEASLRNCKPILGEKYKENMKSLEDILATRGEAGETGIIINEELCSGCGNCVTACPVSPVADVGAGGGKDPGSSNVVLRVKNGRVRIVNLKKCRRFGRDRRCRICADVCPYGAIEFV